MKMRMTNDQLLGGLSTKSMEKKIDSIQVFNRHIRYLHTWKGEKKKEDAILFIHGSPGALDAFYKYMSHDSLLSRADLIAYDRPGFGYSGFGKAEPSLRKQASILTALMDSLAYKRYWLVGHSYGGPVIIQAVLQHPRHISGICIISGSVIYELEPRAQWRKWIDLPFIRPLLPVSLKVSNQELMPLRGELRMIDDDYDKITTRVSLIHGTKDRLVPFDNLEKAKEKLVNASIVRKLIFEEENHFIPWTQQQQIVKEIIALMEET